MTRREGLLVTISLSALIWVQLAATDSFYLLRKYLWLDELCTYELITDRDLGHAFRALQGAIDINPPGLHILLLAYTKLVGSTSEMALRSFALVAMVVALVGIYAVLREAFGVLVAVCATLAVWSHPLILDHAFEVRYYGPWLAAAVWFSLLFGRAATQRLGPARLVCLAAASFFLCTIHYFGIVTLAIIVAAQWLWLNRRSISKWATAAVLVGPIASVASVVLLLPGQRSATTIATWIPTPSMAEIVDFGTTIFLPMHLAAFVIVAWVSQLTTGDRIPMKPSDDAAAVPPAVVGMTSLALLFPVLVAFSYSLQSVMVSRYGLTAIATLAPASAFAIRRMSKRWVVLLIAFLIASSTFELRQRAVRALAADRERDQLIQDIRNAPARVIFEAPHQLHIVWHYAPDLRNRVFLLDFEKEQLGGNVSPFRIWTRDLARQFLKFYDGPHLIPWEEVRQDAVVYLVPHADVYIDTPSDDDRYPRFSMRPVHGQLHQLVRANAP